MGSFEKQQVAVVMVPFLAQSHLNQLLQFSCLITASYSLPVFYVSSSIHIKQVKTRANTLNPSRIAKIQFHELPMADFESPHANPNNSENNFPAHLHPSLGASLSLREPFSGFLQELCRRFRRVVIIHDTMMSFVVKDAASVANAESYAFNAISAFSHALFSFEFQGKPFPIEYPKPLPCAEDFTTDEMMRLTALAGEAYTLRSGDLFNTSICLESPFLNVIADQEINNGRKIWAIAPMLQPNSASSAAQRPETSTHTCLEWLNQHEPNSVIYVSFGTTTCLTDEQITELALGLEESGANFLWILREADRGNVFDGGDARRFKLPRGFEERIEGRGYVFGDWAPQLEILAHPSTGGFMSHCGWNSCLESIRMGVPLAAWPMHSDQPRNGYLVTEVLKAGLVVREWTQRKELMKSSVIADVVRRLMASDEGDMVRKRTRELGEALKSANEEGGVSRLELDSFIAHVTRK